MIDVNDLMCGNWVYDNGFRCAYKLFNVLHNSRKEDYDPIPVTADMLKRIGFEEYEDLPLEGKFYRYWDKNNKYKLDVRNFWTNSKREWYIHIDNGVCETIGSGEFDYLHELQNLVRINCGADLPITEEMIYE